MNLADPGVRAAFFAVHSGLPREGPGDRESTARALALAGELPTEPRVLDIACGPGAQTSDLAELLPGAEIVALDLHEPFLLEARRRLTAEDRHDRVRLVRADMAAMPFRDGSFDLVWCEGAAYVMGVLAALRSWKRLLAPGGRLAPTEAVWLTDDPPERVRACWSDYPAMTDVAGCRAQALEAGYRVLGDFVLPEEAWWADYYGPMEARLRDLEPSLRPSPAGRAVRAECLEEIAVFREFHRCYGYAFFVLAPLTEGRE